MDILDPWAARQEQFDRATDRTIRDQGYSATEGGLAIVRRYIKTTSEIAALHIRDRASGTNEVLRDFLNLAAGLDPDLVALCALSSGINAVAACLDMNRTLFLLGSAIEAEAWAQGLYTYNKKLARNLEASVRKRHGNSAYRKTAIKRIAAHLGYNNRKWSKEELVTAGQVLLEILTQTDAFMVVPGRNARGYPDEVLAMTEEAVSVSDQFVSTLLERYPVHQPLLKKPRPWRGLEKPIEYGDRSYMVPLVRKDCKVTHAVLTRELKQGKIDAVLSALNAIESVPWKINERVLDVVSWAYNEGVAIEGLPPRDDLSEPDKPAPWEDMDEDQRKAWRMAANENAEANRGFIGQRRQIDRDVATARSILEHGNKFWTVANMDYRGRIYYCAMFNFQRQDYVRSLFLFADGEPLGETGLKWLKIHLANCGDFDKVSKKSFDARLAWVEENHHLIVECAYSPRQMVKFWSQADAPFMFLAACIEYANAIDSGDPSSYRCHLPCNWDGSCSGLQHLALMTRCEDTAPLVNVVPTSMPSDIYQRVWDDVLPKFERDADHGATESLQLMGRKVLAYNGGRGLVKRNVMVYSYGSKKYGMADQHREDLMKPLKVKVMMRELATHPFVMPEDKYEGQQICKYLASHIFDTIEETVHRPAKAMVFLQHIAKALAHEGKPVIWHTPLGFPVVLRCPNVILKQVRMHLQDKGVSVLKRTTAQIDGEGIDKTKAANTIAPSFVHSYDACHLQMVALQAHREGIRQLAFVHDSMGCLPSRCEEFRAIILEQLYWLYSMNDVLEDIRQEALDQIQTNSHRIPDVFASVGSLDTKEVLNAQYAFA